MELKLPTGKLNEDQKQLLESIKELIYFITNLNLYINKNKNFS